MTNPEVKAEVLRRLKEVDAHPEMLEPWEGTLEHARRRLNEFRRQKAQPRSKGSLTARKVSRMKSKIRIKIKRYS